jgi:putative tricarboxylic transport membrane protein
MRDTIEIKYKLFPIAMVTVSLVVFALTVNRLGVLAATFLSSLIAAYGGDQFRWRSAIIMSVVLSVACWLIFFKALGLPFPAIGSWLRF